MNTPSDWWQTFFSGLAVDCWLQAVTEEQTKQEADFILEMLKVAPPANFLDVPCGGGRHSIALAARGYRMTGVDISTNFLKAARSQTKERSLDIRWEQRDMRDLPWPGQFDGAFSFGNSFGYLDDAGNAVFLKSIYQALKPGARFVLDTGYILEALLPNLQEKTWYSVGDVIMLAERRYDPALSRLHVEYTWIRDGRQDKRAMSARLYSFREVVELFAKAGFTDMQGFGSFEREPFQLGSHRLLMVATKA